MCHYSIDKESHLPVDTAVDHSGDGAEPSANSVSALSLLRLSHYTGRGEWAERSRHILAAFSDRLIKIPIALPEMVRALTAQYHSLKQVVIAGQPHSQDTQQLISCVNSHFVPNKLHLVSQLLLPVIDFEMLMCPAIRSAQLHCICINWNLVTFASNPFMDVDASDISEQVGSLFTLDCGELEMEILNLQNDIQLKARYPVSDFWTLVDKDKHRNLCTAAMKVVSLFGSTYLCDSMPFRT
ncbi:UNVERIFIED_CONTAM: hypothetical protein FKN15_004373 [Acipenser sinensis]